MVGICLGRQGNADNIIDALDRSRPTLYYLFSILCLVCIFCPVCLVCTVRSVEKWRDDVRWPNDLCNRNRYRTLSVEKLILTSAWMLAMNDRLCAFTSPFAPLFAIPRFDWL